MIKNYEAFAAAHKDTLDAFMRFNTVLAEGFQELSNHASSLTKRAVEMHVATGKAAVDIRSPQELTALHSSWASQVLEAALDGSTKLSSISVKISSQAVEPIQSHFSSVIGKMTGGVAGAASKES